MSAASKKAGIAFFQPPLLCLQKKIVVITEGAFILHLTIILFRVTLALFAFACADICGGRKEVRLLQIPRKEESGATINF